MNYLRAIMNIGFGLVILAVAFSGLRAYFGGNKKEVKKYEQLLSSGESTMGILDSVYSEVSFKGIKVYSVKYEFQVDEKSYEGTLNFDSPADIESPIVDVRYLAESPEINAVEVEKSLAKAKEDASSSFDLWLGIIGLIVSIFVIWSGVAKFRSETQSAWISKLSTH